MTEFIELINKSEYDFLLTKEKGTTALEIYSGPKTVFFEQGGIEEVVQVGIEFLQRAEQLNNIDSFIDEQKQEDLNLSNVVENIFDKYSKILESHQLSADDINELKERFVSSLQKGFKYSENITEVLFKTLISNYSLNNIKNIELNEDIQSLYKKSGTLVSVRPCAEEYEDKTFLGIYFANFPQGANGRYKGDGTYELSFSHKNPYIYIFETNTFVWGSGSWWKEIESEDDLENISDKDIYNSWYMQLLNN